jgi:hypothetical protein
MNFANNSVFTALMAQQNIKMRPYVMQFADGIYLAR